MTSLDASAGRIGYLLNQVRWATRISAALSTAQNREDIYAVLVSGLVSPIAVGFQTALVFDVDETAGEISGRFAIGIGSSEELDEMREDLRSETEFIERRKAELQERAAVDDDAASELRTLELGSQWVTIFQRLGTDSEQSRAVQSLRWPLESAGDCDAAPQFFRGLLGLRAPRAFGGNGGRAELPPELDSLLPGPFAVVPLRTNRGLRALVFVDRRVTGEPITSEDLDSLDWFATQGAIAIQNAELIADLETAYSELKAVDQLKSNFLSIISHELRTPLTAITGFVELILNKRAGDVNNSQRNLLKRVAKNTGHLNNMVNDLIEIAEIEAEGVTDISLVPVDPLNTLFATLPKLDYRRRDHKVDVQPIFDGELPRIVCDERSLERIFFHLLDNAVKFSEEGVPVDVEFEELDDSRLSIAICDCGAGIPGDKLKKIFDQFYQVDNSLTRSHEGLGIGLAVTRMLVQATRGEIRVESTLGKGSRFTLIYPVAESRAG